MKRNLLLIFLSLFFSTSLCAQVTVDVVAPKESVKAQKKKKKNVILDVRTPQEYAAGHLEDAVLLDWRDNVKFMQEVENYDKSKTYYIYCRSGRRSNSAAKYMKSKGFKVYDMQGGINNWCGQGLKVVK
jgi:rhodanese-related sulfurtransferase